MTISELSLQNICLQFSFHRKRFFHLPMSSGVSAPSSGSVAGSSGVSVQTNTFTSVHHDPHVKNTTSLIFRLLAHTHTMRLEQVKANGSNIYMEFNRFLTAYFFYNVQVKLDLISDHTQSGLAEALIQLRYTAFIHNSSYA